MEDEFKEKKGFEYSEATDVKDIVQHFVDIGMFKNIDMSKMVFIRSVKKKKKNKKEKEYSDDEIGKLEKELDEKKGKRKYIARTVTLNKFWKQIFKEKMVSFVIEVASENFDILSDSDKTRVIIHECMHIPDEFETGRLRAHDEFNDINIKYNKYKELNKTDKYVI